MPYLPIDPKDVGRDYEAVIRINSQSGKGGIAYILQADHGLDLPRPLQIEFSKIAQEQMDREGKELTSSDLWTLFTRTYMLSDAPLELMSHKMFPAAKGERTLTAELKQANGAIKTIEGTGNGPIDAFVDALKREYGIEFSLPRLPRARCRVAAATPRNGCASHSVKLGRDRAARACMVSASILEHRGGLTQGRAEWDAARASEQADELRSAGFRPPRYHALRRDQSRLRRSGSRGDDKRCRHLGA